MRLRVIALLSIVLISLGRVFANDAVVNQEEELKNKRIEFLDLTIKTVSTLNDQLVSAVSFQKSMMKMVVLRKAKNGQSAAFNDLEAQLVRHARFYKGFGKRLAEYSDWVNREMEDQNFPAEGFDQRNLDRLKALTVDSSNLKDLENNILTASQHLDDDEKAGQLKT